MLAFPWKTLVEVNPEGTYAALLGVVHLNSVRLLPRFVHFGAQIERQLCRTPGAIGFRTGMDAALGFYHLSAWVDAAAIHDFVETAPHIQAVEQLTGRLGHTVFRYWTVSGAALPMYFRHELHRLEHP